MNFLNLFFLRELISPLLVGIACFVLGTHHPFAAAGKTAEKPAEDDLAVLNGCVVSACNYLAIVKAQNTLEKDFWAKILLVRYENNSAGHAYTVWETEGTIYGYDRNNGGFPIPGYTRDPKEIATILAEGLSKHLGKELVVASADFVEPTAQLRPF